MYKLTLRKIGHSLGAAFPKEMLERLRLSEGDSVYLVERNGEFVLAPDAAEFEGAMEAFEEVRREFRDAFRELAK